ncbi:MAG: DUF420 domain-containing protein [Planctomycetota bacterium]
MPGFLPYSRASFMLDFVAVAMFLILPILTFSIYLVKSRKNYRLHKQLQVFLGALLLVAVALFELDIRIHGWRHLAEPSPYYHTALFPVLYVHLFFAVSTSLLWVVTIVHALRVIPSPPAPGPWSKAHKRLAIPAALTMYTTAITGWTFYYMAFVAGQ